jgi:hypothetical protein
MKVDWRRAAPVLTAAALGLLYVIVSPTSFDLAAHLLRAKLFSADGFGIWDNWWYAGHHTPGYSTLFPPVAAASSPQLAGAIAATATAALFEPIARARFGPDAWVGATWFALGTATNLFTGRLAFAFGLLPAMAGLFALLRRRPWIAALLGALTALCSPVASLFAALAGAAHAAAAVAAVSRDELDQDPRADVRRRLLSAARVALPGAGFAAAALTPVGLLAVAFPEGGMEPFALATLLPLLPIAAVALVALPPRAPGLRAGVALYAVACVAAYAIPSPVGSNAARLGPLAAGPLAALVWYRRRPALLALAAVPLLYLQLQAAVRDVRNSAGDPAVSAAFYQPLLNFLARQPGPPFRVEIPFTYFHWEAYQVAPRFPLARGWERQLDIKDNHLFYGSPLNASSYAAWLRRLAVRFVALPDSRLDYSAQREAALIRRGLPYLRRAFVSRHWRVYEVADAPTIVEGVATLQRLGASTLTLAVKHSGTAFVRVHFTPYWSLSRGAGCVSPDGDFTRLTLRRVGLVTLSPAFALDRVGARSRRCS